MFVSRFVFSASFISSFESAKLRGILKEPFWYWGWNISGAWWRHQMETFSALLALCAGNSPVTGEFPSQRPVTKSLFSLTCTWIKYWENNRKAGDFRRHRTHYDTTAEASRADKLNTMSTDAQAPCVTRAFTRHAIDNIENLLHLSFEKW